MDLDGLLPEPPEGFKKYPAPSQATGRISALYHRLNGGIIGGSRVVWVAEDSEMHPRVIEVVIALFSTQLEAANSWKARPKVGVLIKAISPTPVVADSEGELSIVWTRPPVTFTAIGQRIGPAIVSCLAADDSSGDAKQTLRAILSRVGDKMPAAPGGRAFPLAFRQVILGVLLFSPLALFVVLMGHVFGDSNEDIWLLFGVAALLAYYFVWPKLWQRVLLRRSLREGDHDGTIRRALASLGVPLP